VAVFAVHLGEAGGELRAHYTAVAPVFCPHALRSIFRPNILNGMIMLKAYRYRLYPTSEQETLFRQTVGCCRFVYNLCLDQRKLERHRSNPRRLTAYDQISELTDLKAEAPWLREVPHHALCQAIIDLDKAFKKFFAGAGFPKFRKRGDRNSFRYPDPKQFKPKQGRIFLPKAGWVTWVQHCPMDGKPKAATVSREADCWYVSIQCEMEVDEPRPNLGPAVGIDIGVAKPLTLSTGEVIELPRSTEQGRHKLAALQRKVARKTKGSRNQARARLAVARFQARLARRRKDAAHKATTRIAKSHGVIVIENLMVRNMTASAAGTVEQPGRNVAAKSGLNRSILDVAPYQIRSMLEYKAAWYGSRVIAVNPAFTSQMCRVCGSIHPDNRTSQASFVCRECGHEDNADLNAATNILRLGLKTGGRPGVACESNRAGGRKQERRAARRGSSVLQGRESSRRLLMHERGPSTLTDSGVHRIG
jgi:transposase, IS605 OrfB family, central region